MPTCAIFAIGNELLTGSIIDTNSAFLGSLLTAQGFTISEIRLVPDQLETLVETIEQALGKYDFIICTGGLGPTFDDVTAAAVGRATKREISFYEQVYEHIVTRLQSKNVPIRDSHRRQAYLPDQAILFPNPMGTAYGFGVESESTLLIAVPGVPYEMKSMMEAHVAPFLTTRFSLQRRFMEELRFTALPESEVDDIIEQVTIPDSVECIINVSDGEIVVRLKSDDQNILQQFSQKLRTGLEQFFVGYNDETLAALLVNLLKRTKETIAVAESCTGGLLGQEITAVPGSSEVFLGGIIVYSNWAKTKLLQVPESIIDTVGPVSAECASALVKNLKSLFNSSAAISITGLAGPSGGTAEQPVGTVFIGLSYRDLCVVKHHSFSGDRQSIRQRSKKMALWQMITLIRESSAKESVKSEC
ncbi:CinA family nicotinamide mononucleotide deamidase-related protein [candidate division CSSED10-310 bacterium]|uniref:CinA-like protein n=1 Tax=candidate division CSSED10-310 bacterium TaxID=2855610 RepID=A0ABV6YRK3_UNCC1